MTLRLARCASLLVALLTPAVASAQAAPPAPHDDTAFDFMNLLNWHGLHNIEQERWNAYGQFTYISSWQPPFQAPYTNTNGSTKSLIPEYERGFTGTFTLYLAVKLWRGSGFYFVPEVIAERPLSGLNGIGGAIENFELQKTGSVTPQLYRARTYLQQTFDFGGKDVVLESNPMQLGTVVKSRRLVVSLGNFSILDFFDKNNVTSDPRQTFFNMAFMTYASWDFPSDARGYSWGAVLELYWDDWALRYSRITPPQDPNQLPVDFRLWQYYGDEIELEHDHKLWGHPGAVRILGYRNNVFTGNFSDAIALFKSGPEKYNAGDCPSTSFNYGSGNFNAPDLCWVRKPNVKLGIGIDLEQFVAPDIGVFLKAMYSDGLTEVDAFNAADRSLCFGAVAKGTLWHRPFDVTGIGVGISWVSASHAEYLELGGIDGFIGDGALSPGAEGVSEAFYSFNLFKAIWLAADYQFLWNPGYNTARGPVNIIGAKAHAEF